jgi:hypothetical protein
MEKEESWKPMTPMTEKEVTEEPKKEVEVEDEIEEEEELDEYEIRCAADCLLRAEEIKKDKKLFDAAIASLKEKKSAINSIADLRSKAYSDEEESSPESKKKDK